MSYVYTVKDMGWWRDPEGDWYGVGNHHHYRIVKAFFGTGKTNFSWEPQIRDADDESNYELLSEESHIRYNRSLTRAKEQCWHHDQKQEMAS